MSTPASPISIKVGYHAGFLDSQRPDSSLADEVRVAMSTRPRALPPAIAFDAVGHALYARVTALPQHTLARAESELVRTHGREIMEEAGWPGEIVDLNAGTTVQARSLLREIRRYVAVEPCRAVLDDAVDGLEAAFPHVEIKGIVGEPSFGIAAAGRDLGARLVLLLGSYVGRFDPTMARLELARIRGHFEPEDRLLVGMDLAKDAYGADAYDDSTDVYPAFVRNALRRTNREVGTDFRSADWRLVVDPQPDEGRVEIRFEACSEVVVTGGRAGGGWDFTMGEPLVIERAYKPSEGQMAAIAIGAGFRLVQSWIDSPGGYGIFLLAP